MPSAGIAFRQFLNIRSASGPTFSPDGRRIAFLTDVTGVPQVWAVAAGGGWPDQLTFEDERVAFVEYAPTANQLVMGMDLGGNERQQFFLLTPDGSTMRPLTDAPDSFHTFGGWSRDSKQIAYAANTRHPAHFDIYVMDVVTGESRRVYEHEGTNFAAGFTPDGRQLLVSRYTTNLNNDLFVVDLNDGTARPLTSHADDAEFSNPRWAADGRGLYLLTNRDREFMALVYLDLANAEIIPVAAPDWDVELLDLSRDGRLLAFTVNADGYSELYLLDTVTSVVMAAPPGVPRGVIASLTWSPDARRLAFTFRGPRDNADVWLWDRASGRVRQLTKSARAGIPRRALAEPELVHFPSFDGRSIPAFLYRPRGRRGRGLPVLMYVHGGPESQERPAFNPLIQYFASRGYAVLAPNVRGSTGYGKSYTHLDDVRLRMDSVADLEYAVRWLRESGVGDPTRIAVMGGSYGGFMTLAALTTYPDLFAAGVDIVGIANWITFLNYTSAWRRNLRAAEYGDPETDAEFLREISPIHKVDRIRAALMVIHGANDPRVPVDEAEQMVAAVRARGGIVEYLRFEDEGHGLVKRVNRIRGYTAVGDFLDRALASKE